MRQRVLFILIALLLNVSQAISVEEQVGFAVSENTEFLITNTSGSVILGYGVVLSGTLEIKVSPQIGEFLLIAVPAGQTPQVQTFFGYVDASGQLVIVSEQGGHVLLRDWLHASRVTYQVTPVARENLARDVPARGVFERVVTGTPPVAPPETPPVVAPPVTPPGHATTPPGQGGTPPGQGGTPPGRGNNPNPPGQGGTPPGQRDPGEGNPPPGQGGTPPGQGGTPPGQGNNPNPPGQGNPGNPGQGNPGNPGQGNSGRR